MERQIDKHKSFWKESKENVIIEGFDFPALQCQWDSEESIVMEYITKFSLEKVIGKGKVKNRLKKWEENYDYIVFDKQKNKNNEINKLINDSMKSSNCPHSGTLLLVSKVKIVFSQDLKDSHKKNENNNVAKKLCILPTNEWTSYRVLFEEIEFDKLPEPHYYQRIGIFFVCMWFEGRVYCSLLPWKTVYIENRVGGDNKEVLSSYLFENNYSEGMQKLFSLLSSL